LRVPGTCDAFELAVRAIVGKQISVASARTLLQRLVDRFGPPLEGTAPTGLSRKFPDPVVLAAASEHEIRSAGLTAARARTVIALAQSVARGAIELSPGADVERTRAALEEIRGIGSWTSSYIAMRALRWPDAFPDNDLIMLRAMGETRALRARVRSEVWRPWRAYAVMHLWRNAG
jgi:AraC family transcriptional regulator of adaptative response / DNA-3-methyladenine glycosylase II